MNGVTYDEPVSMYSKLILKRLREYMHNIHKLLDLKLYITVS